MRHVKLIIAALFLVSPFAANADIISFNATFDIDSASGSFAGLVGSSAAATIDTDDACGSNVAFGCSNMNAVLNLVVGGVDLGTNAAGWISIFNSAMADYPTGGPSPFTYIDPVYDDVIFEFYGAGDAFFRASYFGPDDVAWLFDDGLENIVAGTFGITSRVPEPSTLALLGIGLAAMGFSRRRKII